MWRSGTPSDTAAAGSISPEPMIGDAPDRWRDTAAKVPAVTLAFWVVKVLATTLGETGGDSLSMSMGLGYLVSALIFVVVFAGAVALQIRAARFHPWIYWFTIVATTTLGTTIADYVDRSVGMGYPAGTAILALCLLACLGLWRAVTGSIDVTSITGPVGAIGGQVTVDIQAGRGAEPVYQRPITGSTTHVTAGRPQLPPTALSLTLIRGADSRWRVCTVTDPQSNATSDALSTLL